MQQSEIGTELGEAGPLTADLQKIIAVVSRWAADRPIIADVTLFGSRLRPDRPRFTPVELAVRYDEHRMIEGFDDWIEQLRTNHADLRAALSEPVSVLTPDLGPQWQAITSGLIYSDLRAGKVRVLRQPSTPRPVAATRHSLRTVASHWRWSAIAALNAAGKAALRGF